MTGTWSIELAFAQEVVGGPTQGNTGSAGAPPAQARTARSILKSSVCGPDARAPGIYGLGQKLDRLFGQSRLTLADSVVKAVMSAEELATESLFSYGTLRQEDVQLATFGRRLAGRPDALAGYALKIIQIQDQSFAAKNGAHQRTLQFTGSASDVVEGVALAMTRHELEQADEYEPDDYERVCVHLRSGQDAWVYLQTDQRTLDSENEEGRCL